MPQMAFWRQNAAKIFPTTFKNSFLNADKVVAEKLISINI